MEIIRRAEHAGVKAVAIHARFVHERPRDRAHWGIQKRKGKEEKEKRKPRVSKRRVTNKRKRKETIRGKWKGDKNTQTWKNYCGRRNK